MLKKYAQEISEYLSSLMGRSIIITDISGIIIGAPAKERIGTLHRPSVPCIKYKKISFDDEETAKTMGVWYPGSTVPIFYNGRVIGTAAIAGPPEVVLEFTMLVKNQIESILREKINSPSLASPQKKINELVHEISLFDPATNEHEPLIKKAGQLGINLDVPRAVMSIFFSNFRGLQLDKNPMKISYDSYSDPIADEIDYSSMHGRVIEILREKFPDPQNIIASASRDRFVVIRAVEYPDEKNLQEDEETVTATGKEIYKKLKEASIETIIGLGHQARTLYELPSAYKNAWDVVKIAEKLSLAPGVYHHSGFMLCDMLLSLKPNYSMRSIEKRIAEALRDDEANELIETFMVYCESFFSKQLAAEKLHLHRNTLSYRLQKLEERLGLRFDDFPQVNAYYLALKRIKLI